MDFQRKHEDRKGNQILHIEKAVKCFYQTENLYLCSALSETKELKKIMGL